MSPSEFTEAGTWGGRPVARRIAAVTPRARVVVQGSVVAVDSRSGPGGSRYECTLDDGSGQLVLVFLGRREVAGLMVGTRCAAEGTALIEHGRLVVWNPLYRIDLVGG